MAAAIANTCGLKVKIKKQICSVLAGYVWDKSNPFVARHKQSVRNLANLFSE